MQVTLTNVGQKYQREWVIKHVNHQFQNSSITGIQGANGSGKSTLLLLISSILAPSEGSIDYSVKGRNEDIEQVRTQIAHIAPAIDLVPQMTVQETLDFHLAFSPLQPQYSVDELLSLIWLNNQLNLKVSELSSGMRQRLKLGLAFLCQNELLLLDEPTSNLDDQGIELFNTLIEHYQNARTLIIASNETRDFEQCHLILDINQWKPQATSPA